MLDAATILAALALCAAALPSPNSNLLTRAVVEHNGRQIDCNKIAFLAVMPPSELELKCRAAQGLPSAFERREEVDIHARAVVEHNGRQVDCAETAFLAVMPASELELKCRAAAGDIISSGKRSETPIMGVVVGKRQVVDFQGGKLDCGNMVFRAINRPEGAEEACRGA